MTVLETGRLLGIVLWYTCKCEFILNIVWRQAKLRRGNDSDGDEDGDEEDDDEDVYSDYMSDSDDSYNEKYWNGYGTNLSDPKNVRGYVADFSFLKNLGTSWEKVKIKYTPTYMERYYGDCDPVAANVLAVPVVEESLAGTAKELVGGAAWAVRDYLEDEDESAAVWVLDVERKKGEEKTGSLGHLGLHSYLAPCDKCNTREEKFRRQLEEHGNVRFIGDSCGAVVSRGLVRDRGDRRCC